VEFAHATRVPTSRRGLVKTKSASQDPTDRTAPLQDSETAKTQRSAPSGALFLACPWPGGNNIEGCSTVLRDPRAR